METNKNIEQLLEMLDHPEAYSEQEIMDIVNRDEETQETYRQLVQAKRTGNCQHSANQPIDVDEAWEQFEQQYLTRPKQDRLWRKAVAVLAGVVLMSGLAWATVHTVRHNAMTNQTTEKNTPETQVESDTVGPRLGVADTMAVNSAGPVVFDNVPLDQMLTEIAGYYGMTVEFQNDEARNLRFHFVWNKDGGLAKVLEDLSHFDSVNIEQTDDQLIVQ